MDDAQLLGTVERVALANLAKKARAGQTLSEADWQRFADLQRKLEGGDPDSPLTPLLAELREYRAAGKAIPKRLERVAREAWLADVREHVWPDLAAAAPEIADELGGVSVQTVKNKLSEWGVPFARQALSKATVWLALARHFRAQAAAAQRDADSRPAAGGDDLGAELKRMRLIERRDALRQAAHDCATQALQRLIARFRPALIRDTAARAAERLDVPDRIEAERVIGEEITDTLAEIREEITRASKEGPTHG